MVIYQQDKITFTSTLLDNFRTSGLENLEAKVVLWHNDKSITETYLSPYTNIQTGLTSIGNPIPVCNNTKLSYCNNTYEIYSSSFGLTTFDYGFFYYTVEYKDKNSNQVNYEEGCYFNKGNLACKVISDYELLAFLQLEYVNNCNCKCLESKERYLEFIKLLSKQDKYKDGSKGCIEC